MHESEILSEIFNPSCHTRIIVGFVYVDNSEFVGSTGAKPGGVIRVEKINLKITNSVFRLTEHSNPPQTGGFIFISRSKYYIYISFYTDNVTFDARELTGSNAISIISSIVSKTSFNGAEILCPQAMMINETAKDKNGLRTLHLYTSLFTWGIYLSIWNNATFWQFRNLGE